MNQLDRIEQKLDKLLEFFRIPVEEEREKLEAEPRAIIHTLVPERRPRKKRIGKRQVGVEADLLLGMTTAQIIERNGVGALASVFDKYDPKFKLGAKTDKGSARRAHTILNLWFEGKSFFQICCAMGSMESEDVAACLCDYHKNFGIEILDPMPGAKEKLSQTQYRDGNLAVVAERVGVNLPQVVRDYVQRAPEWPLDDASNEILVNLFDTAKSFNRRVNYNFEPLVLERLLHHKATQRHLRWISLDSATLYRVQLRKDGYVIETKKVNASLWKPMPGSKVLHDTEPQYAILDEVAQRQIRSE